MGKTYRKSDASLYHACEEQEFEMSSSSEETMYYAEQVATVDEVLHIGSRTKFHSIKLNCFDIRMQNDTGSSMTIISTKIGGKWFSNPGHKPTMDQSVP